MTAIIDMPSEGLLAKVVWALYYVFHAVRDGMHRELTMLQKLPSPCIAELLRVSCPTSFTNTSAHRANGDLRGDNRISNMYFMLLGKGYTESSPCCRSYPVLVEQSCFEYLVPQISQTPLYVEQMEGGREGRRERDGEREEGREGGRERGRVSGE